MGKTLMHFEPLQEGVLIKRYKRFLADICLDSGEIITAHCPNTGPMKGVLVPNGRVRVKYCPSKLRKLSWTWEQAKVVDQNCSSWVGVNTSLPNKLIKLAIEAGLFFEELGSFEKIRPEVPYGKNKSSRIDLLVTPDKQNVDSRLIYIEVKNTTWKEGQLALFPDTITIRGQKHLNELIDLIPKHRGVLIPCISRNDVDLFAPGDSADKKYGDLFRRALKKGVQVLPCSFSFYRDCIQWEGKINLRSSQYFS